MHPILLRIPMPGWDLPIIGKLDSIPIYSYGVMLGLSLVVGWYLTLGLARRDGLPRETMANNYVITAIVAVVASRLLYVVTNLNEFDSLGDLFSMRRGGLVAYGGFLGGFLGSLVYLKRKRIRLMPWADVAVPSLASGLAITRIGCYLFGCDFGQPLSESAPGWLKKLGTFPHWAEGTLPTGAGAPAWVEHVKTRGLSPTATHSLPVHPTQLYESLVGVSLLLLLLWARRRQHFRGQIFFLATFAYGVGRFVLEILRDDPERGNLPGSMAEHLLIPFCLVAFAVGYALSFARLVDNVTLRRITQGLAFVPAVVAYVLLRPDSFAGAELMQLSTSQFIGLASALAVAGGYVLYDKAAREHPETAMSLGLPEDEGGLDDEDEDDEAPRRERRRKRAGGKKRKQDAAKAPKVTEPEDDEDEAEAAESGGGAASDPGDDGDEEEPDSKD
jgi:phosphatidylglycerol:prolipoprotein diacylglycerol transferase